MKIIKGKEKEYKDWYDKNSDGVVNPAIMTVGVK